MTPSQTHYATDAQLGFDTLLRDADAYNQERTFKRETAHLPCTWDKALPFYRTLLRQHHAAVLAGDEHRTMALREEAHRLARVLNGGDNGILAHEDAPGYVLARKTAAALGRVPLWGQSGAFEVMVQTMKARIEMRGIFEVDASTCFWPGFSVHAVEGARPFLSPTGYRSFLGISADPVPGLSPDRFVQRALEHYIARELGGALVAIRSEYRERCAD